ncbi:polysaccharide deacetylase family protein [Streptomyces sp. RFCAC02]|uniref:polysaccharide deacetylase family protein n=1 Tax=Streptomyces sp. RFCAC02 TaxID=2499143 RepID=UPI00101EB62C|nr:polysaccharide deacetylase family protein [Streptomyces sp. RFCAC02]
METGGESRGPAGPPARPGPRRIRRCLALGGAAILALTCAGPGLPAHLLGLRQTDAGPDHRLSATVDGAPKASAATSVPLLTVPGRASERAARVTEGYARALEREHARRVTAARAWGLRAVPLRAPEPPEEKPELTTEPGHITGPGLPPVIVGVPTDEKIVFLTIDDGAEKDPALLRMLDDLGIPYTGFLADEVAREDYGYFRDALADGHTGQNHSLNHREMTRLSYAEQLAEICGQQAVLERELGQRPTLFRPPYGAYDANTLRAAAECGAEVVPLWAEEAFPDRMEYGRPDGRLHPGDIILTHFRGEGEWDGSMTDLLRRVLDTVTEQGFAIARLEDYV